MRLGQVLSGDTFDTTPAVADHQMNVADLADAVPGFGQQHRYVYRRKPTPLAGSRQYPQSNCGLSTPS